jgi:hypothetical protein
MFQPKPFGNTGTPANHQFIFYVASVAIYNDESYQMDNTQTTLTKALTLNILSIAHHF